MKKAEEYEAKFLVPDATALDRAVEHVRSCGARVGRSRHFLMRDIYVDTADRWLLRAGIGLRVRWIGRRAVLTAKTRRMASGRLVHRIEWEEKHDAARIRLPGPLPRGRLAAWLKRSRGPTTLTTLIELDHDRREYPVWIPGGARAKLCLDRVRVPHRTTPAEMNEVEIELIDGSPRALKRFARRLEKASGWRPDGLSKLERALRHVGLEVPALPSVKAYRIRAGDRLADAAWQALRLRFAEFCWNEPGARAGLDPEYLHDMRVAARRMRAALRIFRGALSADFVERADRELRRIFADMGRVRDLDVSIALLRSRLSEARDSGVAGWVERLERRRRRAWNRLLRGFCSPRFEQFLRFMEAALTAAPDRTAEASGADRRVGDTAPKILRRCFRKALESAFALDAESPESAFHEVRIRFKKLRYALELFADLHPRATRKLCKELAEIQDVLGEFQDEVVLRTLLRQGGGHGLNHDMKTARTRLETEIEERIAERQSDFLRLRDRLDSKTIRRLMDKLSSTD